MTGNTLTHAAQQMGAGKSIGDKCAEAAHLINKLTAELVILLQHLVPQVTVHALHDVPGLDLEQTAAKDNRSPCCVIKKQSDLYTVSS